MEAASAAKSSPQQHAWPTALSIATNYSGGVQDAEEAALPNLVVT